MCSFWILYCIPLITQFQPKVDLGPFGNELFIYWHGHSVAASPVWVDITCSWGFACLHRLEHFHQFFCGKWGWHAYIPSTVHSSATSFPTCLEKLRSGLVKRPFWSSCDAIALAPTEHMSGLDVVLPVRRLIVCQAFWLECVKSMDSTATLSLSNVLGVSHPSAWSRC